MASTRNQPRRINNPASRGIVKKSMSKSKALTLRRQKISDRETKSQKCYLTSLPTELLEMIIEQGCLDHQDHWNLRRVSSRLFHMTDNAIFLGGDFRMFRYALRHADTDMMNRCKELNPPPPDITWAYEDYRIEVLRGNSLNLRDPLPQSEDSLPQGPGYFLLEGFRAKHFSADKYIRAAEWLMDNGFKVFNPAEESIWNAGLNGYFISYRPLDVLTAATSKKEQDDVCRIIEFLHTNGYEFLLRSRVEDTGHYRTEAETLTHDKSFGAFRRCYDRPSLMLVMMKSGCPASILELYLEQLEADDMSLKGLASHRHEKKQNGNMHRFSRTEVAQLIDVYLDELFGLWTWRWETPEQMGDTLQDKIELLILYDGIDEEEEKLLRDILSALRRIEAKNLKQGGLDYERDASWCWAQLFMSVTDIDRKRNRVLDQYDEYMTYSKPWKCLHEFFHTIHW
ncbi:hypothetical protein ACHAPY_000764 [Fusarium culmorum]